jgi:hypothetical protein
MSLRSVGKNLREKLDNERIDHAKKMEKAANDIAKRKEAAQNQSDINRELHQQLLDVEKVLKRKEVENKNLKEEVKKYKTTEKFNMTKYSDKDGWLSTGKRVPTPEKVTPKKVKKTAETHYRDTCAITP